MRMVLRMLSRREFTSPLHMNPTLSLRGRAPFSEPSTALEGFQRFLSSRLPGCFLLIAFVLLILVPPRVAAQTVSTGVIEGRVQNAASGSYLINARVSIVGTTKETLTDASGEYRLGGLPVGEVTLEVFFTGMASKQAKVSVQPGTTVRQDFRLVRAGETARDGDVVYMNAYVVASEREYDATAIAINEQRFAANRKDVVSTDAFGEINQGNIGEFVKFLPGVTLDVKDGNTPSGIMIRGFDPNYTNVTLDGGQLASTIIANTQTSSRQFVLDGANINNLARIEVTKLPTPDMSANLLGGAVNFVSRSAFERPRMETRISTYFSANAKAMDFNKTAGPLAKETFKILPSADFMFVHPVSSQFGYVVTAQHSSQYYLQNRTVLGARFTSAGATLDNPYTTNINTNLAPNRSDRDSAAVKFDYKPWDGNVFSLHLQANASKQQTASRGLNYNVGGGTPLSWTQTDVRGANGGGSVGMGNNFQERHALTRGINGSYRFTNDDWAIEAAASYSNSNNRTRDGDKGFFRNVNVSLPGVARVNLLGIQQDDARFSNAEVYNSAGTRIDELSLANYYLTTAGTERLNATDDVKEARLNVARELTILGNPVTLKVGGSFNDMERDLNYTPVNYTYVGPDGIANNADNTMASFVDTGFAGVSPGFGRPAPQWPDSFKVWQSFIKTPNYWTQTTSQAGDVPRNVAIRSPWLHETITAAYVMGDIKLLRNRLRIVGGVRYELTEDEGLGFKQDADAVLVKDASGNVLDTDPSRPGIQTQIRPELAPSGSFAYNSVLYAKRQYYAARDYHYYHPSAHVTYNITDNLLVRAAYAKTIGRPNLSDIVPNLFVGENINFGNPNNSSGNIPGFITGANIGLRPWRAKNYDYSIEYYLPKNGVLMFNAYRKDIKDFFSSINVIADQALLDQLGLSSDALGYQYTRRINISDARIDGWEARADLPLVNLTNLTMFSGLGDWLKPYTFTTNFTHLSLSGSRVTASDWKRFIPRGRNFGLRFNFPKISGMFLVNWRGKMLRDTANQFPGANEYIRARYQVDGNIEYQLTKHFAIFAAGRNLFNAPSEWEVSGPGVPAWSTLTNYEDYGAQYSFGVKGSF